ncbi:luciferin sulfotransferase [Stomoxys calcitrans]|uniref:luciferin sulfotransferase n=1 Tax=Stomoxys calcitrans TaxID=35570 RepID=UPI0027E2D998|nr:luciferin sulfotransferase [Stomoxys calcitrans]
MSRIAYSTFRRLDLRSFTYQGNRFTTYRLMHRNPNSTWALKINGLIREALPLRPYTDPLLDDPTGDLAQDTLADPDPRGNTSVDLVLGGDVYPRLQRDGHIIYVARNCKDVVVSSYHFIKSLRLWQGDNLEDYVNDFINSEVNYSSYWTHIIDFWQMRNEPYICFVTYEDMKRDLTGVIERLCTFLERPQLTAEEMENILQHLSFESMKENDKTNLTMTLKDCVEDINKDFQFMRRGIVGSFKDELTPDLKSKIDNWSQNFLVPYGLTEEDIFGKL